MAKKGKKADEKPSSHDAVALETLRIDYLPIDAIKPNDYNPNRQSEHDFELLCKSIDEDGMTQPVVVLKATNTIVDGEHRWRACKALGHKEVPVVLVDMGDAQARVATLRHNRARGSEDVELAAAVLRDLVRLGASEWAKDSLNLDEVEIKNFLQAMDTQDGFTTEEIKAIADSSPEDLRAMVVAEGGEIDEEISPNVQDVVRAREMRLREARTEQERETARRELSVYRLRLVYTGDEGSLVRRVLSETSGTGKPIDGLLELCRRELSRN